LNNRNEINSDAKGFLEHLALKKKILVVAHFEDCPTIFSKMICQYSDINICVIKQSN